MSRSYVCATCGAEDESPGNRGPIRTRCRQCMWAGKQFQPTAGERHQFICAGCSANVTEEPRAGRRRRFCNVCRPAKDATDATRRALAAVRAERARWKAENRPRTDAVASE